MEPVQSPNVIEAEAGLVPVSALDKKHDDLDVLKGCPRDIVIQGLKITQRAWRNHEYSNFSTILLYLGFGDCDSEEEVDAMTIGDVYANIAMKCVMFGPTVDGRSLEEFLYFLMQAPKGHKLPSFAEITKDEFEAFLAVILEQNNMLKLAKKLAKKNLQRNLALTEQLEAASVLSESPRHSL